MSVSIKFVPLWVAQIAREYNVTLGDVASVMTKQDLKYYDQSQVYLQGQLARKFKDWSCDGALTIDLPDHCAYEQAAMAALGVVTPIQQSDLDLSQVEIVYHPDARNVFMVHRGKSYHGGVFVQRLFNVLRTAFGERVAYTSPYFDACYIAYEQGELPGEGDEPDVSNEGFFSTVKDVMNFMFKKGDRNTVSKQHPSRRPAERVEMPHEKLVKFSTYPYDYGASYPFEKGVLESLKSKGKSEVVSITIPAPYSNLLFRNGRYIGDNFIAEAIKDIDQSKKMTAKYQPIAKATYAIAGKVWRGMGSVSDWEDIPALWKRFKELMKDVPKDVVIKSFSDTTWSFLGDLRIKVDREGFRLETPNKPFTTESATIEVTGGQLALWAAALGVSNLVLRDPKLIDDNLNFPSEARIQDFSDPPFRGMVHSQYREADNEDFEDFPLLESYPLTIDHLSEVTDYPEPVRLQFHLAELIANQLSGSVSTEGLVDWFKNIAGRSRAAQALVDGGLFQYRPGKQIKLPLPASTVSAIKADLNKEIAVPVNVRSTRGVTSVETLLKLLANGDQPVDINIVDHIEAIYQQYSKLRSGYLPLAKKYQELLKEIWAVSDSVGDDAVDQKSLSPDAEKKIIDLIEKLPMTWIEYYAKNYNGPVQGSDKVVKDRTIRFKAEDILHFNDLIGEIIAWGKDDLTLDLDSHFRHMTPAIKHAMDRKNIPALDDSYNPFGLSHMAQHMVPGLLTLVKSGLSFLKLPIPAS